MFVDRGTYSEYEFLYTYLLHIFVDDKIITITTADHLWNVDDSYYYGRSFVQFWWFLQNRVNTS